MSKTLDYYLALASPWTYLAGPRLDALIKRNQLAVNVKPFDLMRIFAMIGTKIVRERPAQIQRNRLNELRRWRDHLGMKLTLEPKFFPVDQKPASRVVIAAIEAGADGLAMSNRVLKAVWAEERDIADRETLAAIVKDAGLDAKAVLAKADSPEIAAVFERNTEDAIANHVFGSPTWIFAGELFWGQDRLEFLSRAVERANA